MFNSMALVTFDKDLTFILHMPLCHLVITVSSLQFSACSTSNCFQQTYRS